MAGCFDVIGRFVGALWCDWPLGCRTLWCDWLLCGGALLWLVALCGCFTVIGRLVSGALMWLVVQKRGGSGVGVLCCDWSRRKMGGASPSGWLSTSHKPMCLIVMSIVSRKRLSMFPSFSAHCTISLIIINEVHKFKFSLQIISAYKPDPLIQQKPMQSINLILFKVTAQPHTTKAHAVN